MSDGTYEFPEKYQVSVDAIHLISRCLQYDEKNRLSIDEIMDENYVISKRWSPEKQTFTSNFSTDFTLGSKNTVSTASTNSYNKGVAAPRF